MKPLVTRKEIATHIGVCPETVSAKYSTILAPARSRALDKPISFFRQQASDILIRRGITSTPLPGARHIGRLGSPRPDPRLISKGQQCLPPSDRD